MRRSGLHAPLSPPKRLVLIGGGSTYTPELINWYLTRTDSFPKPEPWLIDIDPQRLAVERTSHWQPAKGDRRASYVITQLRVGMMPAIFALYEPA